MPRRRRQKHQGGSRSNQCFVNPALEEIVAVRVNSGRYASASEVIREALRLLKERDQLNHLRHEVRLRIEQLVQGRKRSFNAQTLKRIKRQGRKRVAAGGAAAQRPIGVSAVVLSELAENDLTETLGFRRPSIFNR
jgi:antitoxin ParD1/3/4